ncbi:MAG: NYN domain-containing protein [Patescibacteria group bacterium]
MAHSQAQTQQKKEVILYIDGENLLYKLEHICKKQRPSAAIDLATASYTSFFHAILKETKPDRMIFYTAKIRQHPQTKEKSAELIKFQRKLRNTLVKQGFEFVIAGSVRGQKVKQELVFKEKGVDVRIAVDMVSHACDGITRTAIICSSDSDLQPAIREVRNRGVKVVYIGFSLKPNKGMRATTNKTVLVDTKTVISCLQ